MTLHFDRFEIDPDCRRVRADGLGLHLTPKAFDLLWLLVEAAPRVVTKARIHDCLWPGGIVSDATVVGLVKEIRRVLGAAASGAPLLRTVHRIGYALDVPVGVDSHPATQDCWLIAGSRRIALSAGQNIIGRDPASAIWLDHPCISRRHACLVLQANQATLEDLGSKNGTRLDGKPVQGVAPLKSGDEFTCGEVALSFVQSDAAPPTATVAGRPGERGWR